MGDRAGAGRQTARRGRVDVVGLGPAGLERVPPTTLSLLTDPEAVVVVRTLRHPAAAELAERRPLVSCDDLYEEHDTFEEVYRLVVERVSGLASQGPVVYAVPGSPLVGELAAAGLRAAPDLEVVVHPAESFLDLVLTTLGLDPLRDGLQLLDAHHLPDPLVLDKPTLIAHLSSPVVLADAAARLGRVLPEGTPVTVLARLGSPDQVVAETTTDGVDSSLAGDRTSLFVPAAAGGLVGAVQVMRRLRAECPWDRQQTHHSLIKNLVEETFELVDALSRLPEDDEPDWVAYADVEDELGDVLLQVLFHCAIGRERGTFDIDDVAEGLRQKLVRRHPHVFADVEAGTPEEVKANWDRIKEEEKAGLDQPTSVLDGVPAGLPALWRAAKLQNRAAKVGFDWAEADPVLAKVREELDELAAAMAGAADGEVDAELGDVLFSVVNLARHLDVDPEVALRRATDRFETRFRAMEAEGPLEGLTLAQLDQRWERAKE